MRVLEAKATKEAERKLSRRLVLEVEEGQLMEERKKRKDDKRKKESAQKKTAEQKNKGSETAKSSVSQPVIASITSPSTVASSVGGNNAKRAVGTSQQQVQPPPTSASRYPPREVPPRFRHQEQKQLLKRGQPLPGITANLGSAFKHLNGQPGGSPGAGETPATGGGEGQSSSSNSGNSPKQTDLNHSSALGAHHESFPWGPVSSSSGSSPNWDQVTNDDHHPRKESWSSATNTSDSEPPFSECMDTFESGSSSGLERNLMMIASRGHSGQASGLQDGTSGHSGHAKPADGNNHMGKGGVGRSWGLLSSSPALADVSNGTAESSHSQMDKGVWSALGLSNGEIHPSTLNSNGHPGAWPGLVEAVGPGGSSSTVAGGQLPNPRGTNSNPGGSWKCPQENCKPHLNGTRKMPRGGQNSNPEMSGPNHTTNFTTSSLPNPAGSGQANELVNSSHAGTWGLNGRSGQPSPQACLVINGTLASHQGHEEAQNGATSGTAWGPNYSGGDFCSYSSSHTTNNTVNAPQRSAGLHGAVGSGFDISGVKGPWEGVGGTGVPQKALRERGLGLGPRGGGQRRCSQSSCAADGERSKPSTHTPLCEGGNGKKFTSLWQAAQAEEEKAGTADPAQQLGFPGSHGAEQKSGWTQPRTGENTGQPEGPEGKDGLMTSHERRKVDPQALLQSIISRADLDPRVLSNTGWGQTPIKQNTAWDTTLSPRGGRKASSNGTEAWGGLPGAEKPGPHRNGNGWGEAKSIARWESPKGQGDSGSHGGWQEEGSAPLPITPAKGHPSWGPGSGVDKDGRTSCSSRSEAEKLKQGWGEAPKACPGWAMADSWGENSRSNHWGEMTKSSSSSSDSDRSGCGWKGPGKPWSSRQAKPSQSQGWGEAPKPSRSQSWGETPKPPEVGYWGAPPATSKPQGSTGWLGGPMPAPSKEEEEEEPTGWEEPSPESIRRKIEIDDGTSAWGDPSKYSYKGVHMWNTQDGGSRSEPQSQRRQREQEEGRTASTGASAAVESGGSSSGWGEPPPSVPATVDNGTSAWGRPVDTGSSWGEVVMRDTGVGGTWGNPSLVRQASNKPGPKPMQAPDGWYGGDMPLAGSQQPSWEEEDGVEIGMWNSHAAAQEANSTSLHWAPCSKKLPPKSTVKNGNKQDDMWMNPFVKQFANLGFPRESPEEVMQSNKIDIPGGLLPDKWMEMEKHNLNTGDYSRVIGKNSNTRPQMSKESSMDRNPCFDKEGLVLAEEFHKGPFMSHQNANFPPSNSALPNQALGSLPGLSMPNLNSFRQNGNPGSTFGNTPRSLQQPPAQALNSAQPSPRAQVPPPLLSPQVPVSLLKYTPNNGGLSPLFGPQQVAMLNQLTQLNQISQLHRLLAQQRKVQSQRNTPVPGRQQHQEPQQQNRSLGLQSPGPLDPALLLKQQLASSQPSLHHSAAVKSFLDNAVPHASAELQKGPSQANSAFSNFPIGLNSNLSVNIDMGSIKEPQSRLRKWMTGDSISTNTSLDPNASRNGAMSSGFRLEEASPFLPYNFMDSSSLPASPPLGPIGDSWSRAKSPNGSSSVNWPPEFRPGEPWKGYPNIDPETDPYITPGSVTNNLSVHTVREADHLRDRSSGSSSSLNTVLPSTSAWSSIRASNYNLPLNSTAQSTSSSSSSSSSSLVRNGDSRSAWSPASMSSSSSGGSNTSLAHELWKVPLPSKGIIAAAPSRPPPGLTGQKGPLSTWGENPGRLGGGWNHTEARYTPGSSWGESSSGRITNCLVLKNLTPQIDGSTLRTLCMQHGPLMTFHLNLPHGNALVRYSSKEEVLKAQKSLHMCVLGNTTILAEFPSEEEINRFFAQGQSLAMAASTAPSPGWQSLGGGSGGGGGGGIIPQNHRLGSTAAAATPGGEGSHPPFPPSRNELSRHWNGGDGGGDLHSGTSSLWGGNPSCYSTTTSLWGSLGGPSSPLNAFLSLDHLGATAGSESM